ncbi:MAG TPA: hypothetical protein VJ649_09825 [Actinomycetes bacterium]|nr:hypothetical protein [Actinomycetes bacterium]
MVMAQGTAAVIRVLADAEDAYTIRQIGRRAGISHARAAQVVALLDRHGVADPAVNAPSSPLARTVSTNNTPPPCDATRVAVVSTSDAGRPRYASSPESRTLRTERAAMGAYESDSGPTAALRMHLSAARTEAARIDPKAIGIAIRDAREQLANRPESLPEPLPERIAALQSRVAARFEKPLGESDSPFGECGVYVELADAFYDLAHDATDFEEGSLWYQLYLSSLDGYADCAGL